MASTTEPTTTLPASCARRAQLVRAHAATIGLEPMPTTASILAYRLNWDAPAAGEYPRPMMRDAVDLSELRPELAERVWHHVAGATILGAYCCGTPAFHRDALCELAREIRPA